MLKLNDTIGKVVFATTMCIDSVCTTVDLGLFIVEDTTSQAARLVTNRINRLVSLFS